ncbi:MAG: UDP-N-acetylglucosamine--N-acetylmuramyl-(pentapeptide) pyrophosphoryl-undecaprenol [Candidatus Kaiserbacteria bacterium]|nr:UDP-N-acetylglucosamine--N-acetylmuramyl-(pentapeptide) pyrophosphoryl-undecaprenol [Candidatus Kaiserbacteria bacterium]
MKIVLTGGGTGGHFYPLIAVAEAIEDICKEKHLIEPELIFTGPEPFDRLALDEHDIVFMPSSAGKMRRHSNWNIFGMISTGFGIVRATTQLFGLYPDVVFSTGGFASFPTLVAARLLRIPVLIYDADTRPGRVSLWSSKFARWIAVGHPDSAALFPKSAQARIAHTGHPIRKEIVHPAPDEGGYTFLKLDASAPTILILGGSQGAQTINETVLDALGELVTRYNVIHQTGSANLEEVRGIASVILKDSRFAERYRVFGLLNTLALRMAAGITGVIIARAGSGTIFEVASWGIPGIFVPIPLDVSHDQTENAFSYARSGAAVVIEQQNLSPHVLIAEIDRIMGDKHKQETMKAAAQDFSRPDAAKKIALILLEEVIAHQPV